MTLDPNDKTDAVFVRVKKIMDTSFDGVELPPDGQLRNHFFIDTVFVDDLPFGQNGVSLIRGVAFLTDRGYPHIWSIAVAPQYRGRGVGKKLLEEIEAHCREREQSKIELNVRVDNPAQKLYFDCGYRAIRVAKNYYIDQDAILMRRIL